MTAIISASYAPTITTTAGGHAWMQKIHDELIDVGLTPVYDAALYDGTGSDSQLTLSDGFKSSWMAFNFSDGDQATKPITVWIRLECDNFYNTSSPQLKFLANFRISTGYNGSFIPPASSTYSGFTTANFSTSSNSQFTAIATRNFIRYSGDTLTMAICVNGFTHSIVTPRSGPFLHVERRRNSDGSVADGFVAELKTIFVDGTSASAANHTYAIIPNSALTSMVEHPIASFAPSVGNARLRAENSAAIVYPISCISYDEYLTTFRKVWLAPSEFFTNGTLYTLNFQGVEKTYLALWSTHVAPHNISSSSSLSLAFLYEWE